MLTATDHTISNWGSLWAELSATQAKLTKTGTNALASRPIEDDITYVSEFVIDYLFQHEWAQLGSFDIEFDAVWNTPADPPGYPPQGVDFIISAKVQKLVGGVWVDASAPFAASHTGQMSLPSDPAPLTVTVPCDPDVIPGSYRIAGTAQNVTLHATFNTTGIVVTSTPPAAPDPPDGMNTTPRDPIPPSAPPNPSAPATWDKASPGFVNSWRTFTDGNNVNPAAVVATPFVAHDYDQLRGDSQPTGEIDGQAFDPTEPLTTPADNIYEIPMPHPVRSSHVDNVGSVAVNAQRGVFNTIRNVARIVTGFFSIFSGLRSWLVSTFSVISTQMSQIYDKVDRIIYFMGPIDIALFGDARIYGLPGVVGGNYRNVPVGDSSGGTWQTLGALGANSMPVQDCVDGVCLGGGPQAGLPVGSPVPTYSGGYHVGFVDFETYNWSTLYPTPFGAEEADSRLHGWKFMEVDLLELPIDGKAVIELQYPAWEGAGWSWLIYAVQVKMPADGLHPDPYWKWLPLFSDAHAVKTSWDQADPWGWFLDRHVIPYNIPGQSVETTRINPDVMDKPARKFVILVHETMAKATDQRWSNFHWGLFISSIEMWTRGRHTNNITP